MFIMNRPLAEIILTELEKKRELFTWRSGWLAGLDEISKIVKIRTVFHEQRISAGKIYHILKASSNEISTFEAQTVRSLQAHNKLVNSMQIVERFYDQTKEWADKMDKVIPVHSQRRMRLGSHRAAKHRFLIGQEFLKFSSAVTTAVRLLLVTPSHCDFEAALETQEIGLFSMKM